MRKYAGLPPEQQPTGGSVCAETTEEDWRTPMSKGDFANLMLLITKMADTHLQIAKGFESTTKAITMIYQRQEELMAIAQAQALFPGGSGGRPN